MNLLLQRVKLARDGFTLDVDCKLDYPVIGVYGPSGSGKTTLLHLIAGLLTPTEGCITVGDEVMVNTVSQVNRPAHRRRIGVLFQDGRLFPHLNVKKNLMYGRKRLPVQNQHLSFDQIVSLLEIAPLMDRSVRDLSGGEQQRVALGRALLAEPRLLLLDEPLTALDARLKQQILQLLRKVREEVGTPTVYVSHDLDELLSLTDQLLVLDRGRLVGFGAYVDLCHQTDILPQLIPQGLLNMLTMSVMSHDESAGCTTLSLPDSHWKLEAPLNNIPVGRKIKIIVRAQDIALSKQHVDGLSIRNQFEATITRHTEYEGQVIVELDVGVPLLAEISLGSFHRMGLGKDVKVSCLIKSNAVRWPA